MTAFEKWMKWIMRNEVHLREISHLTAAINNVTHSLREARKLMPAETNDNAPSLYWAAIYEIAFRRRHAQRVVLKRQRRSSASIWLNIERYVARAVIPSVITKPISSYSHRLTIYIIIQKSKIVGICTDVYILRTR